MKLSLQLKAIVLATVSGLAAVGMTIAAGEVVQSKSAASGAEEALTVPLAGSLANQGHKLFLLNCAHCHGTDARGDEGPDLHGLTKSDQKLTSIIQNGVKGEMPKFSAKLNHADTHALIAFIRTLKQSKRSIPYGAPT
jgi:mono/diheme cytochrome c family protein